jgi:hypothetical protein
MVDAPCVAHPGSESADQLEHHIGERALVRHHTLDAFRTSILLVLLEVPIGRCGPWLIAPTDPMAR